MHFDILQNCLKPLQFNQKWYKTYLKENDTIFIPMVLYSYYL